MMAGSLFSCVFTALAAMLSEPVLPVDLSAEFQTQSQGAWQSRFDHRNLLVMRHPWQPSQKGDFILAWKMVTVPADWQGPVTLSFYCSDDYHTDSWRPDGSWLTAEGFIGHRLKQVLADNQVVWSQDVSDSVVPGQSPVFRVPVNVRPGQTFRLSLLAYDAEASATVLPQDFYQSAKNEKKREEDADANKFLTHIYWGDLVLLNGDIEVPAGKRPVEAKVRSVHNKRWPLPHFGDGWDHDQVRLDISAPAGLPKLGFPLQMGIPVPAGKTDSVDHLRFQNTSGQPLFAQKAATSVWPDDSIRWVFADFPARSGMPSVVMTFKKDDTRPAASMELQVSSADITVKTGVLEFSAGQDSPLARIRFQKNVKVENFRFVAAVEGEEIPGSTRFFDAQEKGPYRATICNEGQFATPEKSVGSYSFYCSTWADFPYIKLFFRYFNDTKADVKVSKLEMAINLPAFPKSVQLPSGVVEKEFSVVQTSEKTRLLDGAEINPAPPMYAAWEDNVVVVNDFQERYPKAMRLEGNQLIVDMASGGNAPVVFTPGEATSQEVWVAFGVADAAQFAATAYAPPILQNAAYYCATGVLGPAWPSKGVPKLAAKMTELYSGKTWADLGQSFGIRDFPDAPYYGGLPEWSNNYYERMLNFWSEWFISGDRAWYDRASDVCRHIMDVAIVHSEVPGHDWLGAIHGPGKNHVSGPWNPTLRIAGLDLFQKLTDTPEARDAFLGVADYCVRAKAGIDGGSVRQQAGPFDAICTAYQETLDAALLAEGTARVQSAWRAMDRRRGVWSDEHGSKVYRGNVPWMDAQMARPLYWWYRLTGDLEAAQAVVGLAESMICENTDWDHPEIQFGYSHNPHYAATDVYDPFILPVFFAAHELTEDTFFLDAAKAVWNQWAQSESFDSVFNTYWNTPWLVWYLHKNQLIPQESEKKTPPKGK